MGSAIKHYLLACEKPEEQVTWTSEWNATSILRNDHKPNLADKGHQRALVFQAPHIDNLCNGPCAFNIGNTNGALQRVCDDVVAEAQESWKPGRHTKHHGNKV